MGTKSSIISLVAVSSLLLIIPVFSKNLVTDAYGITSSLFVSHSIKNINGKTTEQLNAGQQAMVSVRVFNYDTADMPFTAIVDVRDESNASVHIEWISGVVESGRYYDADFPWSAQVSGSYKVRTFVISNFESKDVLSKVNTTQLIVTSSDTLGDALVAGNVSKISKFAISSNGRQYTIWFTLDDKNGKQTTFDGKATMTITDTLGEQRYSKTLAVAKADFILFKPDEKSAENIAYVWKVNMLDVERGLGTANAVLQLVSSDGKTYSAKFEPIEINQASGIELAQDYEIIYNKMANDVGKSIVKGNLKVTLNKVGDFTHLSNRTSGNEVTHFRADITIENVGDTINSWPLQYLIVDDKSNEYSSIESGSTLSTGAIIPGYSKVRGYMLFDHVSEDASWIVVTLRGNNYTSDSKDLVEFHVNL